MTCPRCGAKIEDDLYGPCEKCRLELRELQPPDPDPRFGPAEALPYDPTSPIPYRPVPVKEEEDE